LLYGKFIIPGAGSLPRFVVEGGAIWSRFRFFCFPPAEIAGTLWLIPGKSVIFIMRGFSKTSVLEFADFLLRASLALLYAKNPDCRGCLLARFAEQKSPVRRFLGIYA
jgi:hypothetical protein